MWSCLRRACTVGRHGGGRWLRVLRPAGPLAVAGLLLTACAAFTGSAVDPETDTSLPAELQSGFGQALKDSYITAPDAGTRRQLRDKIVYRQLAAYKREFEAFKTSLVQDRNVFSLGSDTAVLALGATGAVVGGAATKAALAAASAFVVGTRAAVDRELFYQATLPALIAQMEAKRLQAQVPIVIGLGQEDHAYPLHTALLHLATLHAASSFAAAISATIEDASVRATAAQLRINAAPATREFKQAIPSRNAIAARLRRLSAVQALQMARDMEPLLQNRPEATRSRITRSDPNGTRLENGDNARQVLLMWNRDDLADQISVKQWTDELDRVEAM